MTNSCPPLWNWSLTAAAATAAPPASARPAKLGRTRRQ